MSLIKQVLADLNSFFLGKSLLDSCSHSFNFISSSVLLSLYKLFSNLFQLVQNIFFLKLLNLSRHCLFLDSPLCKSFFQSCMLELSFSSQSFILSLLKSLKLFDVLFLFIRISCVLNFLENSLLFKFSFSKFGKSFSLKLSLELLNLSILFIMLFEHLVFEFYSSLRSSLRSHVHGFDSNIKRVFQFTILNEMSNSLFFISNRHQETLHLI